MFEMLACSLPHPPEPRDALDRLAGLPGRVLLESAGEGGGLTFLAASPLEEVTLRDGDDPFAALEELLLRWGKGGKIDHSLVSGVTVPSPASPTTMGSSHPHNFAGGVVGFIGYEAGDLMEKLPAPPEDDLGLPLGWFGVYEFGALWDVRTGECSVLGTILPGREGTDLLKRMEVFAERIAGGASAKVRGAVGDAMGEGATAGRAGDAIAGRGPAGRAGDAIAGSAGRMARGDAIGEGAPAGRAGDAIGEPVAEPNPLTHPTNSTLTSSLSRSDFEAGVRKVRDYILAGDLFQANLTRRLSARTSLTGPELYRRLLTESPAPFAAFLDCGEAEIASISPELFLSLRGREIRTSPIKGTASRGRTPDEDRERREGLAASEKNRAENIMIVDLLRNDLSKVSLPGTIAVPQLAEVESHPTVHHLVSTVTGTLAPGMGIIDLLRATFPGGSITGAPKIRAMEILRELEPVRRGLYTGTLGIVGFGGDAELSIAIRTAILREGVVTYGTGGGITLASEPTEEWEETEEKARAFRRALGEE